MDRFHVNNAVVAALTGIVLLGTPAHSASLGKLGKEYDGPVRATLKQYCLGCHSTEKQKGDLDLERFTSAGEVLKHPKVWQGVVEQLALGEMPPKEKPQPAPAEREKLLAWVNDALDEAARQRAGDPGPVVLRRLNNAEYNYTIRDLTGIQSLTPTKEFPADSAAGEGFMNVGNSLVMSPSLMTKYLDAAKDVAAHAVLLPNGIGFSGSTSQRDWAEERLAAIRGFYGRYSVNGGGSAVNLQGIKFDTKDGGVIPVAKYLEATLELRGAFLDSVGGARRSARAASSPATSDRRARSDAPNQSPLIRSVAANHGLNAKYLGLLWSALNDTKPSLVLDPIRSKWRAAKSGDVEALSQNIAQWQQTLWRFTQVGHIGKRDGPKSWQVPVVPVAGAREVRLKLPSAPAGQDVTLYLATSDAGDGDANDFAVWENPRLVAAGRADLPMRDVRSAVAALNAHREKIFSSAEKSLSAAAEVTGAIDKNGMAQLAEKHGIEPVALAAWLEVLGIGAGEARIEGHMAGKMESAQSYDFIKGWTGADALSVIANSSDQHVRVPGNMKPHSVAVHPSPQRRVIVGWQAPLATTLKIEGLVQHAHTECGNGISWMVELRRGGSRQRLAAGNSAGAKEVKFGPFENMAVQAGDVVSVVVSPRDGNHSCDLTAVEFNLSDDTRTWSLAKDVSPNILAGNPHADRLGNGAVWHFYSEPDKGGGAEPVLPAGSLLAKWQSSANADEKRQLAGDVQRLLVGGTKGLAKDAPDAVLHRLLTSLNGPLLSSVLRSSRREETPSDQSLVTSTPTGYGLPPTLFGKHPNGSAVDAKNLCVRAPSIVEVRLPAELAEGCEFVATATLHRETGREGSVQMQALTTKPTAFGLTAGAVREQGGKSTWSDGERPVVSDSPILVTDGSEARKRIEADLDEFRQLFPAALCYTKIVPVDEVVTLTLYYREDDALKRLMLDEHEAAEIDRLWSELYYVSQSPLKLVDAFEQLWQFATQDADPSAFEPLREPIKQHAQEFRNLQTNSRPLHLEGVLQFAEKAYRRSLTPADQEELRGLYRTLREEEIPHEQAIRLTLARTLVAPAFLYRAEKPVPGEKPGPVTDWELATRLSYFLWASAPDAELRAVAASGKLRKPDVLAAQMRRLIRDSRARRLATEFACVWLHVYDFDELGEKSDRHFPTFAGLRGAMYEETIRFFTDLFQNDGSVLNIIDADYTFLNAGLAKHYGMEESFGKSRREETQIKSGVDQSLVTSTPVKIDDGWRRVDGVKKFGRGGVLVQSTTLSKQSGASRTSPILRGNWLCETLLGEKLPRPPKGVPQLPEDEATETLTMRQLTEKHSTDPKCFGCHRRIDPYGYSLEAYDAIGRLRDKDLGGRAIDVKTKVMDGSEIDGLDGLRHYLLTARREVFLKQFCRKLLGYALGRGILLSDGPLVNEMRDQLKKHDFKVSTALETIVRSKQFREIRGMEMAFEE